jgi:hypothetical protein
MAGIKVAFAITIGAVGLSVLISFLSKWDKINQEKVEEEKSSA